MTCATSPSKFTALAGRINGLSRLAGQRAFYAGVAAGVAGTLGAQQVMKNARRRQWARSLSLQPTRPGTRDNPRPIPTLDNDRPGPPDKPRPIPVMDGDKPGSRAKPRRIPALVGDSPGTREKPRPIPTPSALPSETKLKADTIQVRTGSGQVITAADSYRVVRPDGGDTGLALTPALTANGEPEANRWGVTHTASGSLVSGPYPDLQQAQSLATQLSGLRWSNLRVPAEDVEQARKIISTFQGEPG